MKLVKGALLLFVVIGTLGGWVAGLFFGANLGGSVGCVPFNALANADSCSTTYAILGAGIGLIATLIIGFVVKKVLAIVLLLVLLALMFGSNALPSLLDNLPK